MYFSFKKVDGIRIKGSLSPVWYINLFLIIHFIHLFPSTELSFYKSSCFVSCLHKNDLFFLYIKNTPTTYNINHIKLTKN